MLITLENTRLQSPLDHFLDSLTDRNLTLYASDLLSSNACKSMAEISKALKKATRVCQTMHLPLRDNFKVVFRAQGAELVQDWRLSPMAYMLLLLNTSPKNNVVAQLQVEMAKRFLNLDDAPQV